MGFRTIKKWQALLLMLLLLGQGAGSVFAAPSLAEQFEMSLGRGAAPEVISQYGGEYVVPIAERLWLEEVFRRLISVTERLEIEYTLTVLNSQKWNAFSLPGGYIFITKGLLKMIGDNEAKMAAVLGHEIAHVEKKHGLNAVLRQMGLTVLLEASVFWLDVLSADVLRMASVTLLHLLQLGWGREAEFEADALGQQLAVKAGFDGIGAFQLLTDFLHAEDKDLPLTVFRTHPDTVKRQERVALQLGSFWSEPIPVSPADAGETVSFRRNSKDDGRSDPRGRFKVKLADQGLMIEDGQQDSLLHWLGNYLIHDFCWSPTGSYLAVIAEADCNRILIVLDRLGHFAKKLTADPNLGVPGQISWSPREEMLALSFAGEFGTKIFVTYLDADVYFSVSEAEGEHPIWTEQGVYFAREDGWYFTSPPEVLAIQVVNPVPLVLQREKLMVPALIREGSSIRLTRPALTLP